MFADNFGDAAGDCVRDSFANAFFAFDLFCIVYRLADSVRYHFDAFLFHHAAAGVGDLSGARFGNHLAHFVAAGFDPFLWNHAADLVGAGSCFGNHLAHFVTAGFDLGFTHILHTFNALLLNLGDPDLLAYFAWRALHLYFFAATRFIATAATTGIPFPGARSLNTFCDNGTGTARDLCFPVTGAHVYRFRVMHRFADRIADVFGPRFPDRLEDGDKER